MTAKQTVLAIDTATLTASVAVARGHTHECEILASGESGVNTHSQHLLGLIDQALSEAGVTLAQLDGIAVGAGPGSFTGLRIGMATAKGLAFATDTPLWAVSSLAAMAAHHMGQGEVELAADTLLVPVLDARRQEVFVGFFRVSDSRVRQVSEEIVIAPEDLGEKLAQVMRDSGFQRALTLGDGLRAYPDKLVSVLEGRARMLTQAMDTPSAAGVARLVLSDDEHQDILVSGAPSYVRLSEAEIKYPDGNPGGAFKARGAIGP